MPDPSINPPTPGAPDYAITGSRRFVTELRLTPPTTPPFPTFEVRFPAAAVVQVTLARGGDHRDLLPGPVDDSAPSAGRRALANVTADGPSSVLSGEVRATAGSAAETWTLRVAAPDPADYEFRQPDNTPGEPTVLRLMCDPIAAFS